MSQLEDLAFIPEKFHGRARLFPLPGLVMFPHVMQPLHIFEPRYCDMLEESLADDRLIAMALLAPGWEKNYEGRPALEPVACLGRVATVQPQPNRRFNLLLLGLRRVRLTRELPADKTFREAEVAVIEDEYPPGGAVARASLQRQLVGSFQKIIPQLAEAQDQLDELLSGNVPLGMLTDIISYALDVKLRFKQRLLSEANVDRRAALLLKHLRKITQSGTGQTGDPFPPEFSVN